MGCEGLADALAMLDDSLDVIGIEHSCQFGSRRCLCRRACFF